MIMKNKKKLLVISAIAVILITVAGVGIAASASAGNPSKRISSANETANFLTEETGNKLHRHIPP